jgi:hypothetical protein
MGGGQCLKNADYAHLAGVDQVRGLFSQGVALIAGSCFAGSVAVIKNGLPKKIMPLPYQKVWLTMCWNLRRSPNWIIYKRRIFP